MIARRHYVVRIHHCNGLCTVRKSTLVCTHTNWNYMSKTQLIKNILLLFHFQFLFTATFTTDIEPVTSFSTRKWMSNAEISGEICKPHTAKLIDFPNGFAWNYEQFMQYFISYNPHHVKNIYIEFKINLVRRLKLTFKLNRFFYLLNTNPNHIRIFNIWIKVKSNIDWFSMLANDFTVLYSNRWYNIDSVMKVSACAAAVHHPPLPPKCSDAKVFPLQNKWHQ